MKISETIDWTNKTLWFYVVCANVENLNLRKIVKASPTLVTVLFPEACFPSFFHQNGNLNNHLNFEHLYTFMHGGQNWKCKQRFNEFSNISKNLKKKSLITKSYTELISICIDFTLSNMTLFSIGFRRKKLCTSFKENRIKMKYKTVEHILKWIYKQGFRTTKKAQYLQSA